MTIDMAKVNFVNDFFSTILPDGSTIVLNKLDEDFPVDNMSCPVKAVNIEIRLTDDTVVPCPCVIGLGNDLMKVNTDYTEYLGDALTPENMVYCTIEVYE